MQRLKRILPLVALALLLMGCLLVLRPFISTILWAAVLTYSTWPLFQRLDGLFGHRRSAAAFVMVLIITVVLVVPFVFVGLTLAENVSKIGDLLDRVRESQVPEAPSWVRDLPVVGSTLERYWAQWGQDTQRLSRFAMTLAAKGGTWLLRHSLDFGQGIFHLVLSVLVAFFFYRDGERLAARIESGGQRIAGERSQHLLLLVGSTVRGVVYGIIGTGMAQGAVGGLGFWIAGVPSPFLMGLLTFLLSFIPGGAPIVWVPVTIWIFMDGRTGWGIFMALYGLLGISGVDNLIRPLIISRESRLPFITILLGALGGVLAFGFIGIFLGPTLLAVGYCLVKEFSEGAGQTGVAP